MAYQSNNIHIGAGDLFIKAVSDNDYVDVGGCRDASIDNKFKNLDIMIDQVIDPVDTFIIGREMNFEITLVEATLRNLAISFGLDPADIDETDPDFNVFKIYGNQILGVDYLALKYVVPQLQDKTKFVRFFAGRAKIEGGFKLDFDKDKEQAYKVKFKFFPDSTTNPAWLTFYVEKDK